MSRMPSTLMSSARIETPDLELIAAGRVAFTGLEADTGYVAHGIAQRGDVLFLEQIAWQHRDDSRRIEQFAGVARTVHLLAAKLDDPDGFDGP
ncbi:MAG: hypothetical protein U5Q16_16570 [Gammaproteobacteria bacterium]|nr:hypothetical protein [Gammaproteobacteria bacterium]